MKKNCYTELKIKVDGVWDEILVSITRTIQMLVNIKQ